MWTVMTSVIERSFADILPMVAACLLEKGSRVVRGVCRPREAHQLCVHDARLSRFRVSFGYSEKESASATSLAGCRDYIQFYCSSTSQGDKEHCGVSVGTSPT